MSTPRLLAIFDHDGVLVDSLEHHQRAWVELGKRESLPLTDDFIHQTFGMTNPSILRLLLGDDLSDEAVARYGQIKEECYRDLARGQIRMMPGLRSLLDGLTDRGVRLAIGSSGPLPNLLLTVETCGLEGRFSAIASLEDLRRGKPDPEVFLIAAKRSGVDPAGCVVFEDATVGIQAAKAAGMYAVGLTSTHPAEALYDSGADEVVETLEAVDVGRLHELLMERFSQSP